MAGLAKSAILSAALSTTCARAASDNRCTCTSTIFLPLSLTLFPSTSSIRSRPRLMPTPARHAHALSAHPSSAPRHSPLRYDLGWEASNCITGSPGTFNDPSTPTCATQITSAGSNWFSVSVPAGTRVGVVQVYNRHDYPSYQPWLGDFELWLGQTAGDHNPSTAVKCGAVCMPVCKRDAAARARTHAHVHAIASHARRAHTRFWSSPRAKSHEYTPRVFLVHISPFSPPSAIATHT